MQTVEFRVLGPLEIDCGGRSLHLGGPKERAVLAVLLLHANEAVSYERLIEDLWGEQPPESAKHTLAVYVSRLRRALEAAGIEPCIDSRPGGYALRVDPAQLDLRRFEQLVAEAKAALEASVPAKAAELLDEALALWRGQPLADLAAEPFAASEIAGLEERRLAAVELRMEAALELGDEAAVIAELTSLVSRHELRETLREQLMTALYRTGRQVEALEVYRAGRQRLVDELGIEPGERLQELHKAILRHDPAIRPSEPPTRAAPRPMEETSRRRVRTSLSRSHLVALVAVLAAAVAISFVAFRHDGSSGTSPAGGVAIFDPRSGRSHGVASTPVPPGAIAAAGRSLWVTQPSHGTALLVDAERGEIAKTVKIGSEAGGVAVDGRTVWVASTRAGVICRIGPRTTAVERVFPVGVAPTSTAYGAESIWVFDQHDGSLSRVDPGSGRVLAVIQTGAEGGSLAVGAGGVWVGDESTGTVIEVDPHANGIVRTITVGDGPAAIAAGDGRVWVANRLDATVSRIDARTGQVTATIPVGEAPSAVLLARGALWVANELAGTISRIDPATLAQRTFAVGGRPNGLAAFGNQIAVSFAGPAGR